MPSENLSLIFDKGVDFIKSAIDSKGTIFVHWYYK